MLSLIALICRDDLSGTQVKTCPSTGCQVLSYQLRNSYKVTCPDFSLYTKELGTVLWGWMKNQ